MSCCGYMNLCVWLNSLVMDVADTEFDIIVKPIWGNYI